MVNKLVQLWKAPSFMSVMVGGSEIQMRGKSFSSSMGYFQFRQQIYLHVNPRLLYASVRGPNRFEVVGDGTQSWCVGAVEKKGILRNVGSGSNSCSHDGTGGHGSG